MTFLILENKILIKFIIAEFFYFPKKKKIRHNKNNNNSNFKCRICQLITNWIDMARRVEIGAKII